MGQDDKKNSSSGTLKNFSLVAVGSILAIVIILLIGKSESTGTEQTLLSILLTVVSIVVTGFITQAYAGQSHQRNLEMFGLKAAEKVLNLSHELVRLQAYVGSFIEDAPLSEPEFTTRINIERLNMISHLIGTLRSVNDRSLSDWEGVVGEKLEQQKEEAHEQEERLADMVSRVEDLLSSRGEFRAQAQGIETLTRELGKVTRQISGFPVNKPKKNLTGECPLCHEPIKLKTTRRGAMRYGGVTCKGCEAKLIADLNAEGDAELSIRKNVEESISCPDCATTNTANMENIRGSSAVIDCVGCGKEFRATRNINGITTTIPTVPQAKLGVSDPEMVKLVREKLPNQPWPTGVHKIVARELGATNGQVSKAIKHLISEGEFLDQVDGVVQSDRNDQNAPRD